MKQKITITENRLREIIREAVVSELGGMSDRNQDPLAQEALRIWNEAGLENDIEWEESDWVTSGDETYGPCQGFVECDGWEFYPNGNQDGMYDYELDKSEPVEFESPNGESGEFWLE